VPGTGGLTRRRFLGYVLAAPTLATGARLWGEGGVAGALPSPPSPSDLYDLSDMLTDAGRPTANLITIVINPDGTASFAVPRTEVGQGITTAVAMTIADELDLAIHDVHVTLADARPELLWNQITGGSNTLHSIYTPVRIAAAVARSRLLEAAAIQLGETVDRLRAYEGVISAPDGSSVTYGQLAELASASTAAPVEVNLKPDSELRFVGQPQNRIDALDIVTGRKQFAMDLDIPGALPTMVCRPPTINGTVRSVRNTAAVSALPGVTDVAVVPTGVAVRAETFGQCIDALRALDVEWGPGTAEGKTDASVRAELLAAELPVVTQGLPLLTKKVDLRFTFAFSSNSPLETNTAVADVRSDRAEIWSCFKTPIIAQQRIAEALGLGQDAVTCHVVPGGGSFGRRLFFDAGLEAALVSRAMGKPVKLMWHRTDDFRQGRMHPMCTSRVKANYLGNEVLNYGQRHTSVSTDYGHGLGELITSVLEGLPGGNLGFAETVFTLSQNVPYDFGPATQLINEVDEGFNTGSMRNIYSPNVTTAREVVVDQLAKGMGKDPVAFRRETLRDDRLRGVLDAAAQAGQWGRSMPTGTAQGIALHSEYKSRAAVLVEIDCRPATVNRRVPRGYTGPRVTKAVCAVDVGVPINPRGLEAQMQGAVIDGIGLCLTYSVHLHDGYVLEGSWDNAYYTRQWNSPFEIQVIVLPPTTDVPGGAGELGVAPAFAAVACAYARATGTVPTQFPINHARADIGFAVIPTVPPVPASPTDGRSHIP
jgi:isoquinoline 1-oxidoreductase beta subunit